MAKSLINLTKFTSNINDSCRRLRFNHHFADLTKVIYIYKRELISTSKPILKI